MGIRLGSLPGGTPSGSVAAMEQVMLTDPRHWRSHYHGDAAEQRVLRHFSYSGRIRHYWPVEAAQAAVARLLAHLASRSIPETLISQYLPTLYPRVLEGTLPPQPEALLHAAVRDVLRTYAAAGRGSAD